MNDAMDVDVVLASFERILATFENVGPDLHKQLKAVIDTYPFPKLSRKHNFRLQQIRGKVDDAAEHGGVLWRKSRSGLSDIEGGKAGE